MKRVLHIIPSFRDLNSGPTTALEAWMNLLPDFGWNVEVLTCCASGEWAVHENVRLCQKINWTVVLSPVMAAIAAVTPR